MVEINHKKLGYFLIVFSLVLVIILTMVKVDVDNRDALLCESVFSEPGADMNECPAHKSNTSWLIIVSFGIAFLFLASGLYLGFVHSKESKKEGFKKIDESKLSKDEKVIHQALKAHNGSIYQSDLIKITGFSKVKTTRILDKLEHDSIIDRKRRGMTNIIVLK